jgi:hypothetical protein
LEHPPESFSCKKLKTNKKKGGHKNNIKETTKDETTYLFFFILASFILKYIIATLHIYTNKRT